MSHLICALLASIILGASSSPEVSDNKKTIANNLDTYMSSRKHHESEYSISTYDKISKLTSVEMRKYSFTQHGEILIIINGTKDTQLRELFCINDSYAFNIREKAKDTWILLEVASTKIPSKSYQKIADTIKLYRPSSALTMIGNETIHDMILSSNFKIIQESTTQDGNDSVKMIEFDYPHQILNNAPYNPVQSGTIKLAENQGYVMTSYDVTLKRNALSLPEKVVLNTTLVNVNGMVLPSVIVKKGLNSASTYNYDYSKRTLMSKEYYYLDHYGLSDPNYATATGSAIPWFVYITVAGVVCLLLASLLLIRRRKMSAV